MTIHAQYWRTTCTCITLGVFLGIFFVHVSTVSALTVSPPTSAGGLENSINRLEEDAEKAECGGWNMDKSIVGKISNVTGVPGRDGNPLGALTEFGMATRVERGQLLDDGFQFPSTQEVHGWTTDCSANGANPPYYDDTAGKTPCEDPESCENLCARINRWHWPKWLCLYLDDNGDVRRKRLPKVCTEHNGNDPITAPPPPAAPPECFQLIFLGWFYCCTNAPVTHMFYEQCTEANKGACLAHPDGNRNCLRCEGDGASAGGGVDFHGEALELRNETGCRVGRQRGAGAGAAPDIIVGANGRKRIKQNRFRSFYRAYKASFSRNTIKPEVPKDHASENNIPVYCYGRYYEFDPKIKRTITIDKKCIFDISNHEDISKEKMRESQKRQLLDDNPYPDPPFALTANEREKSLWSNPIHNDAEEDDEDHPPFLSLEKLALHSTVQMTKEEPRSSGALIRAFDETPSTDPIESDNPAIENRQNSVVKWWHDQQTLAHKLFTPPVLRIILPPGWAVDLDPFQQLLTPADLEELVRRTRANPIMQPVEVQLEIRDDLLGEVAEFLRNSLLLQLQEEKIPIAIPLASATELRAVRERWCHWYKATEEDENKQDDCNNATGDLKELLDKLEDYAIHMDNYRQLRAELSLYAADYLDLHKTINENIGRWILNNGQRFVSYQTDIEDLKNLKRTWETTQQVYRKFHDQTNMPWCINQRFTTPVYSLLDPWKPDRPDLDYKLEEQGQKGFPYLKAGKQPDLLFDLTHLSVSTGSIKMPVLEPIIIKYDLEWLHAPAETNKEAVIPKLPDLPPVPSIAEYFDKDVLPEIEVGNSLPDMITVPDIVTNMEHNTEHMRKIRNVILRMEAEYRKFWSTLRKMEPDENKCGRPNGGRCYHVEMDLMERFRRIGSRPGLTLKEDWESIGNFRNPAIEGYDTCKNEDWVCQLQNPQNTAPRKGWGIGVPSLDELKEFIEDQRKEMAEQTLLRGIPLSSNPEEILPSFDVPMEIHLFTFTGSVL